MSRGASRASLAGLVALLVVLGVASAAAQPAEPAPEVQPAARVYEPPGYWEHSLAPEVDLLWPRENIAQNYDPLHYRHRLMSYSLRAEDFIALRALCPQPAQWERFACIDSQPVAAEVERRLRRAHLDRALDQMDVDLSARLLPDEHAAVLASCAPVIDAYLGCGAADFFDALACTPTRSAIAPCVARDDAVVERYLDVVAAKKAAFGPRHAGAFLALLARLPLAIVAEVAAGCPQRDRHELLACLEAHPRSAPVVQELLNMVEADVRGIPPTPGVDVVGFRRTMTGYLLSVNNLRQITGRCYQAHPDQFRLERPDWAREGLPTLLACVERDAQTDPIANPAYIDPDRMRAWLATSRGRVVAALREDELAQQHAGSWRLVLAFGLLAAVGFLGVVALPMVWRRAAATAPPGRVRLSAGLALALTLLVLGGAVLAMRELQGRLAASSTSPRTRIADGTFAVLERPAMVARFSDASRHRIDLIKRPLREIVRADRGELGRRYSSFAVRLAMHWAGLLDEPELHQRRGGDAGAPTSYGPTMRRTFGFYRVVDSLMGLVPFLLALATALLYLLPLKDTLREIARGAEGTMRRARGLLAAELRAVALFLGAALLLLPAGGWVLARTVEPLIELLITYSLLALAYAGQDGASTAVMVTALAATMLVLGLCVALLLVTIGVYLGALRKVLHGILHRGQRVAEHRRFWTSGTLAVVGLLAFPLAYALALRWLVRGPLAPDDAAPGARDMMLVPLAGLALLPALLWATRGGRALRFLHRWPAAADASKPAVTRTG